jgi:DNA ligase-1
VINYSEENFMLLTEEAKELYLVLESIDKKNIKVLLAKNYEDQDILGWWQSEKLDGVRAYWDGKEFYSRAGNRFFAPDWYKEKMPKIPLDGELFMGRGKFQNTLSIVKKRKTEGDWDKIKYHVFDAPESGGTIEERIQVYKNAVASANAKLDHSKVNPKTKKPIRQKKHIVAVKQKKVRNYDRFKKDLQKVLSMKGEGLMVRQPKSHYERKRSNTILKVKDFHDTEGKIVGYENGKGKYTKMVGKLILKTRSGETVKVGSGLTDEMRKNPPPIGATVTFKYMGFTDNGKYRHPTFMRMYEKV